jgi:hypothetical protein
MCREACLQLVQPLLLYVEQHLEHQIDHPNTGDPQYNVLFQEPHAIGIRMTDPETVPRILELDSGPRTGLKVVNALWKLEKFDLSIRRGCEGVLSKLLLPL